MKENALIKEDIEAITPSEAQYEALILGLRLNAGVNEALFAPVHKAVDKFLSNGMLERQGDNLRLSLKGMDLANQVFSELYIPSE